MVSGEQRSAAVNRLYKGIGVRAGYLSIGIGKTIRSSYELLLRDEAAGIQEASDILDGLTPIAILLELSAEQLGAYLKVINDNYYILSPVMYDGEAYERIRTLATDGHPLARRFITWVTLKQMTNPNFRLEERGK